MRCSCRLDGDGLLEEAAFRVVEHHRLKLLLLGLRLHDDLRLWLYLWRWLGLRCRLWWRWRLRWLWWRRRLLWSWLRNLLLRCGSGRLDLNQTPIRQHPVHGLGALDLLGHLRHALLAHALALPSLRRWQWEGGLHPPGLLLCRLGLRLGVVPDDLPALGGRGTAGEFGRTSQLGGGRGSPLALWVGDGQTCSASGQEGVALQFPPTWHRKRTVYCQPSVAF